MIPPCPIGTSPLLHLQRALRHWAVALHIGIWIWIIHKFANIISYIQCCLQELTLWCSLHLDVSCVSQIRLPPKLRTTLPNLQGPHKTLNTAEWNWTPCLHVTNAFGQPIMTVEVPDSQCRRAWTAIKTNTVWNQWFIHVYSVAF